MRRRTLLSLLTAVMIAAVAGIALSLTSHASTPPVLPSNPAFESSKATAVWTTTDGFRLNNNEWNPAAGPQTIWGNSYENWGVQSDQAAGNKLVETYPCIQAFYSNVPVLSYKAIQNGFTESMPDTTGVDAELADDVWMNNHAIEMMIWVDNHGQYPAGKIIAQATIDGQPFNLWLGGKVYTFALVGNETTGVTDILASIKWLMQKGYVPATATLGQVDFGWEIASTDGSPMNFTMTNYWLHAYL